MAKLKNYLLRNLEQLYKKYITPEMFAFCCNISSEETKTLTSCESFEEMLAEFSKIMDLHHAQMYRNMPSKELSAYEDYLISKLSSSESTEEAISNFWTIDEQISFILNSRRDVENDDKDLFQTFERAYNHNLFVWECFSLGLISVSTLQEELTYISGKYNEVLSKISTVNQEENKDAIALVQDSVVSFKEYQAKLEAEGPDGFLYPGSKLIELEDEKVPDGVRFDWYDENIAADFMQSFCTNLERKMKRKMRIAKKRNSR